MPKISYRDGCLLCNQCGELDDTTPRQDSEVRECPCGNAESLDAIQRLMEFYNPVADDRAPSPEESGW